MNNSKSAGGLIKGLVIFALCIFVVSMMFYAIIDGIRAMIAKVIGTIIDAVVNGGAELIRKAKNFVAFWQYTPPGEEITSYFYVLDDGDINEIRDALINGPGVVDNPEEDKRYRTEDGEPMALGSVEMDKIGLDSLMLKKMKVVYNASKSPTGAVILAELSGLVDADGDGLPDKDTDDEILKVTNPEQYAEDYKEKLNLTEAELDNLKETYRIKGMEPARWDILNTRLNFISDKIFWFKDETGKIAGDESRGKVFIGAYGVINLKNEHNDLVYRSKETVDAIFAEYKDKLADKGPDANATELREDELLKSCTMNELGCVTMYGVDITQTHYEYSFGDAKRESQPTYTATLTEQTIDLEDFLDNSKYSISVELTSDLLDLTGSNQFADKFMDYALSKTDIEIKAYQQVETEKKYDDTEYKIKNDYFLEVYNFVKQEYMDKYKEIKNNHSTVDNEINKVQEKMDNIQDSIDRLKETRQELKDRKRDIERSIRDIERDIEDLEKEIEDKIDQNEDYSAERDELNRLNTEKANLMRQLSQVNTMINNTTNAINQRKTTYNQEKDEKNLLEKVKNALIIENTTGHSGETEVNETKIDRITSKTFVPVISHANTWYAKIDYSEPERYEVFEIDKDLIEVDRHEYLTYGSDYGYKKEKNKQTPTISAGTVTFEEGQAGHDLWLKYNFAMPGPDNTEITRASLIRSADTFYIPLPSINRADYLTTKYTISDVVRYVGQTHYITSVDTNTIVPDANYDRIYEFLAMLKNKDGIIGGTPYDENGKVVRYLDVYETTTPVGDLFEDGAEMLFKLLEDSEKTQNLVDVFKYIMYIYTGNDYGVTSPGGLDFMFANTSASPVGSDYIVNTGMGASNIVLNKDKLKEAIEKTYSGQTRTNLLSCLDDFMAIQSNKKVNAVFAVAVTIVESSGGTNWAAIDPSTHNWYSIKNGSGGWKSYSSFNEAVEDFGTLIANGPYYFKANKYSVKTIAPTYCNEQWGESVASQMSQMFKNVGISSGGPESSTEVSSGNYTTITFSDGRSYNNYKQTDPTWKNVHLTGYSSSTNLGNSGCAVTSISILCSQYNKNVTPVYVNDYERTHYGYAEHPGTFTGITGKSCHYANYSKTAVVNQLKSGKPTMVHTYDKPWSPSGRGHFFTLLAISDDEKYVYVSDPASTARTGWTPISLLTTTNFDKYLAID